MLVSYPVGDEGLGEPVVLTEGEDYPATTGAGQAALTTTADGDAWLLVEQAVDTPEEYRPTGTLALVHVDVQTGEVTTVEVRIEDFPPRPDTVLGVVGLDCSETGVCAAVVGDGELASTVLVTIDAATGQVLARADVRRDEDADVQGPWLTADGRQLVLLTVDGSLPPDPSGESPGRPALERRDGSTLAPVGAPVPLAEGHARVSDVHLLDDGTVLALRETADAPAEVVRVAPGGPREVVLRLAEVPGVHGVAADPATGWLHVLAVVDLERPQLVSVDPETGERTTTDLCTQPGNAYDLVLTGAGAVVQAACGHDGLWLVGPA
ncbi:hypothetical protein [Blastococcus sp. SYSU D00820]